MRSRHLWTSIAAAGAALALTACGGGASPRQSSSAGSSSSSSSSSPPASAPTPAAVSACTLLTAQDVTQLLGGPVVKNQDDPDNCTYVRQGTGFTTMTGSILVDRLSSPAEARQRYMQDQSLDVAVVGGQATSGVGDAAQTGSTGILVLHGSVVFTIQTLPGTTATAYRQVAQNVVQRLG